MADLVKIMTAAVAIICLLPAATADAVSGDKHKGLKLGDADAISL